MTHGKSPGSMPPVPKVITIILGLIFLGVGLTVIGFLWSSPFGEWTSPPLFFRIFGSLVALVFVTVGIAVCYGVVSGSATPWNIGNLGHGLSAGTAGHGYQCTQCGAVLGEKSDVSPHGDVKCAHCGSWFNIHKK